ncbi:MAG TPA: zinc ribbon domain-containing protein [Planctomycetota bacterium]|nr:zinc ribbon domain-containing protein [Planctomycetota bacterium]
MQHKIDPGHEEKRAVLRVFGVLILAAGIIITIIAFADLIVSGSSFKMPHYAWLAFIGIPLMGVGSALCKFGFMGSVARYSAGEMAPVGKDTFNYVADGTKDSLKGVAQAVGSGLAAGMGAAGTGQQSAAKVRCHKCNQLNAAAAKFCSQCGAALLKTKACPSCGELNDPDSKFCDNCGSAFSE